MSHAYHHALSSARKWGGKPSCYIEIHNFLDHSKSAFCDFRHRAVFHHSYGVFVTELVFGITITNAEGREVPVRAIAEQHIKEDCGGIVPTLADWLSRIPAEGWMGRAGVSADPPEASSARDS